MVRYLRSLAMLAVTLMLVAACGIRIPVPYGSNGLGAIDPPQISPSSATNRESEVASLMPTLVWESFPQQDDSVQAAALAGRRVEDVTYELRLRYGSELVYERRGLMEPRHTVEVPLEPSRMYFWSVRARFRLDGRERVNQWSLRTVNRWYCPETSRMPVIHNHCAYRLATPAATP